MAVAVAAAAEVVVAVAVEVAAGSEVVEEAVAVVAMAEVEGVQSLIGWRRGRAGKIATRAYCGTQCTRPSTTDTYTRRKSHSDSATNVKIS